MTASASIKGARIALPVRSARVGRTSVKVCAVAKPTNEAKAAALATVLTVAAAAPAKADSVDSAVAAATGAVQASGELIRGAISAGGVALDVGKDLYEQAKPSIDVAVKTAAPIVKSGADTIAKTAGPALQNALPQVSGAAKSAGVDTDSVTKAAGSAAKAAGTAVETATPYVSKAAVAVSTADPATLSNYALITAAVLLLGPPVLGVIGGLISGYAGAVTPATALDMLETSGSTVVLDIRVGVDKERSGVIDVPSSASGRVIELEYAVTANRQLRSQLRNPESVEVAVTAMQIAALKKINKGTTVIMMDNNGSMAKTVAKALASKGFGKVYVMTNGFKGWSQAKLQVKPSTSVFSPTVVQAKGVTGTIMGTFGQSRPKTQTQTQTRKGLPAPRK